MDNNSESSTVEDDYTKDEKNVRIFVKQMLQGRIFLGHFQEKRFVEPLKTYKDLIKISETETGLIKDLSIVRKRLRDFYGNRYWIGISDPNQIGAPYAHCIWVENHQDTLGHYWYKIKSVKFVNRKEILLRVKIIRPVGSVEQEIPKVNNDYSFDAVYENVKNNIFEYASRFKEILTTENIKHSITFLIVLLITIVTFLGQLTVYLMEFTLRLMHEMSYVINALTPFMIACLDFCSKIVGGFYLLIAMWYRGNNSPPPPRPQYIANNTYRSIEHTNYPRYTSKQPQSYSRF